MKKSLFIFLCIFVVSFSANSQQESLPTEMDITVAAWERQTGKKAVDFIELLKQPQHSDHPRASSWINELSDRNDPAIDHQLVQLLAQDHWNRSPANLSQWMGTLIRREFADDKDVIAMLEKYPWNLRFDMGIKVHESIVRQTEINMVNGERNLRVAVGHAFARILILQVGKLLGLESHPRLFTWTITILTTMKAQGFERKFADAFHTVENEQKVIWRNFDDLDRLTEFLLTESTAPLESRLLFITKLPRTHHPQLLDWILTAATEEKTRFLQENRYTAYAYNPSTVDLLGFLLKDYLSEWTLYRSTNTTPHFSEKDIETALRAVDLLLNILDNSPGNNPDLYLFPAHEDHLSGVLTILAQEVVLNDPRISERVGQILERNHLPFSKVLQLLQLPGWRDHPNTPSLLVRVIQNVSYQPSSFSNTIRLKELLAGTFWQNHSELKNRVGRVLGIGPYRPVTFENILRSCQSALTN